MKARILFDLDGTLVQSVPTMAAAGNAMLAEIGRSAVDPGTCETFVGKGMFKLVENLLHHTGGVPDDGVAPYLARYRHHYDADPVTGSDAYDSVHAALAHLADAGHGLAVCTQKADAPARTLLMGLGLMPPITGLTGGESLPGVLKPDPRMVAHAAAQLPPGPILFVGDSETDHATAQAAGVQFLWFTRGYWHGPRPPVPAPAAIFDDYADLPDIIATLLAQGSA